MTTSDLSLESLHTTATSIFTQALDACSIESAFDHRIRIEGSMLRRRIASDGPSEINLDNFQRIFVIAVGKAAPVMLDTLFTRMSRRRGVRGICCSGQIPAKRNWRIRYFEGGHPLPNEDSFAAARAALAMLRKARKDTLVIFLISGGASALFDLPLDSGISLEDTMLFHQALLASGAPITEINTIRKHFSAVKGGRLALAAAEAAKLSIILPDVPLRSIDIVASGPTVPDHTTIDGALAVIARYNLMAKFPVSVRDFFSRTDLPESPGNKNRIGPLLARIPWKDIPWKENLPGLRKSLADNQPTEDDAFRNSIFEILLSSQDLVEHAQAIAEKLGFLAIIDNSCDDWDYAAAAHFLLDRFHSLRKQHPRCCLISGGEVTVTIDRTPGAGGRNQHFTLACALELANHPGENLVVFSAGSDGIDGNTRSAGAIADPTTISRALVFGFNPEQALAEFNACPLFTALGDTVVTGPTGHNLRDLRLLISEPAEA
jgi:hydroxypyruvate reductase